MSTAAETNTDEKDIGGISFVIGDPEATFSGEVVSNVKFSTRVNARMKPKKPRKQFKKGTKKLFVSFDVEGAPRNSVADVHWYRGEESFHSDEVIPSARYCEPAFENLPRSSCSDSPDAQPAYPALLIEQCFS